MIRWLLDKWRARQRAIDLEILWPTCKRLAEEKERGEDALEMARAAFAVHAFKDPAWLTLGEDEVFRRIEALE